MLTIATSDPITTTTTTTTPMTATSSSMQPSDDNGERTIPTQVLVKHEEYAAAAAVADQSGNESSTSSSARTPNSLDAKRAREKRSTKSKCPPGLRSGKWTAEEEQFTNMIIHYFKRGLLHVEDGTSLRWYLAKRLNCEAMRVTKKLKGNSSIGKQIFRALENNEENARAIDRANEELAVLETAFLDSLAATGQAGAVPAGQNTNGSTGASSSSSSTSSGSIVVRARKQSPHKPLGKQPPNLEATKLTVPKARVSYINSEDAKLLLHFFVEAQDSSSEDSPTVEKKRLFCDVESSEVIGASSSSSCSSGSADDGSPRPSKRLALSMEALVDATS